MNNGECPIGQIRLFYSIAVFAQFVFVVMESIYINGMLSTDSTRKYSYD